jgi:hypothetical protein
MVRPSSPEPLVLHLRLRPSLEERIHSLIEKMSSSRMFAEPAIRQWEQEFFSDIISAASNDLQVLALCELLYEQILPLFCSATEAEPLLSIRDELRGILQSLLGNEDLEARLDKYEMASGKKKALDARVQQVTTPFEEGVEAVMEVALQALQALETQFNEAKAILIQADQERRSRFQGVFDEASALQQRSVQVLQGYLATKARAQETLTQCRVVIEECRNMVKTLQAIR